MSNTLDDIIKDSFKVMTRSVEFAAALAIPAAATNIRSANPNCLGFTLVNTGANPIAVSHEPNVTATTGVLLAANGGAMIYRYDRDFHLCGYPLYAIGVGGASTVHLMQIIADPYKAKEI
jgi:hypothetical protein